MVFSVFDIGTKKIKSLVAELKNDGHLNILGVFKLPSAGMKRGEPANVEAVTEAVTQAINQIRQIHKHAGRNIFLGINGAATKILESRGLVAVSRADNEIYPEDVDRVVKVCRDINLGHNRIPLCIITKEFIIDGERDIANPIGMVGNRLELISWIVDAFKPNVNAAVKAVESVGGHVYTSVFSPIAASRAVLSKSQKELGVLMIDVGFGTTGIAVYEDDKLLKAKVLPIGANHITNDIAIGLKCPVDVAETIKLSHGCALSKVIPAKEKISLSEIDDMLSGEVSRRMVAEIIESRVAEIFELINAELKEIGRQAKLPAGVVLSGAGAKLPGMTDLAREEFRLSAQIGVPELTNIDSMNAGIRSEIEDPEFAVATGLLFSARDQFYKESSPRPAGKFSLKQMIKSLLP